MERDVSTQDPDFDAKYGIQIFVEKVARIVAPLLLAATIAKCWSEANKPEAPAPEQTPVHVPFKQNDCFPPSYVMDITM